ncbi:MAG: hypothetical protein H6715_04880 [Myxococcales bacterium]|nr:hypothetical protein [Myxococcales bacterium]
MQQEPHATRVCIGIIGAGQFAREGHAPILKALAEIEGFDIEPRSTQIDAISLKGC